ncbi:MAG: OmpA/MotB family protein [Steroidobacteraceae bacterium]
MSKLGLRLHADEEHWIPLSDLMTGLMFLFLLIAIAYMVEVSVQHDKPINVLKTYSQSRAQLYKNLSAEFSSQLPAWGGRIDPNTLSVRFYGTGLFAAGSAQLQPGFKAMLDDFFPRFVRLLSEPQYRTIVSEVRIEGYTSTLWRRGASFRQSYLGNMALSQARTRSVLGYVLGLPAVAPQERWLAQVVSADGFSFSHLVRRRNGTEDVNASQRVEFRVQTGANAQIAKALGSSAAPPPPALPFGPPQIVDRALPPYPTWAAGMIGKPLTSVFPQETSRCWGYVDGVTLKYAGKPAGDRFFGWGYDMMVHKPVGRVLLVDRTGRIVGAGSGGFVRPDVPASLTWIKSMTTGWEGYAPSSARGPLAAWVVMARPGTVCRLNLARAGAGHVW